jgi:predicted Fe-Mo cluster-binding NifX family protein
MKVCFPVEADQGLNSKVYGHFGSAPLFILFDTETRTVSSLNNRDADHAHGQCSPVDALNGEKVDAIIVGGIGKGAINKLSAMNIKVYSAAKKTVEENLGVFENNQMIELTQKDGCSGHGGDCDH